jgi:hypothetical protein
MMSTPSSLPWLAALNPPSNPRPSSSASSLWARSADGGSGVGVPWGGAEYAHLCHRPQRTPQGPVYGRIASERLSLLVHRIEMARRLPPRGSGGQPGP